MCSSLQWKFNAMATHSSDSFRVLTQVLCKRQCAIHWHLPGPGAGQVFNFKFLEIGEIWFDCWDDKMKIPRLLTWSLDCPMSHQGVALWYPHKQSSINVFWLSSALPRSSRARTPLSHEGAKESLDRGWAMPGDHPSNVCRDEYVIFGFGSSSCFAKSRSIRPPAPGFSSLKQIWVYDVVTVVRLQNTLQSSCSVIGF
jgi:hypothetical protein